MCERQAEGGGSLEKIKSAEISGILVISDTAPGLGCMLLLQRHISYPVPLLSGACSSLKEHQRGVTRGVG